MVEKFCLGEIFLKFISKQQNRIAIHYCHLMQPLQVCTEMTIWLFYNHVTPTALLAQNYIPKTIIVITTTKEFFSATFAPSLRSLPPSLNKKKRSFKPRLHLDNRKFKKVILSALGVTR